MLPVEKVGSNPLPSAASNAVNDPPSCTGSLGAVLVVVFTCRMPPTVGGGAVALVMADGDLVVLFVAAPTDLAVVVVTPPGTAVVLVPPPASGAAVDVVDSLGDVVGVPTLSPA